MSSPKTNRPAAGHPPKLPEKTKPAAPEPEDRDRLRDIVVVFITYPLTPTKRANEVGKNHPWLEVLSLVLKAALAAYAIYAGA